VLFIFSALTDIDTGKLYKSAHPNDIQKNDPDFPVDQFQAPADRNEDNDVGEEMFASVVEQGVCEVSPRLASLLAAKK
jgi:hypothetical protein